MGLIVFVIVLLVPAPAWAWGPGAHISFAQEILGSLSMYSAFLQDLLKTFPYDYLYGNIGADIILGRRWADYRHHCHNWAVGLQVLEKARNRPQQSFAYGYLSHLAADTIAHNYFIPYQLLSAYPNRFMRHNYWEMRFDALADDSVWELARKIRERVDEGDDVLLESTLKRVLFSFKTNQRIFSSILLIQRMERWRRMLRVHSRASRWKLTKEDYAKYYRLSCAAISSVLKDSTRSKFFHLDPTGGGALSTAKMISRVLRALARTNGVSAVLLAKILRNVEPDFSD